MSDRKLFSLLSSGLTGLFSLVSVVGTSFETQAQTQKKTVTTTTNAAPAAAVAVDETAFFSGDAYNRAVSLVATYKAPGGLSAPDDEASQKLKYYRLTPRATMYRLNRQQQINAVYDYIIGNLVKEPQKGEFAEGQPTPPGNKVLQALVESAFPQLKEERKKAEQQRAILAATIKEEMKEEATPPAPPEKAASQDKAQLSKVKTKTSASTTIKRT